MSDFYCIACKIERGAFTNERTFEISLSKDIATLDGKVDGVLVGTAHYEYLRSSAKQQLSEDEPGYGEPIKGFVLCRVLQEIGKGRVVVEVPSADVMYVSEESLVAVND